MPILRAYRRYRWVMVSGFHGARPAGSGENTYALSSTDTPLLAASVRRRWNRSRNSSQVSRSSERRRPSPALGAFSMRVPCLTMQLAEIRICWWVKSNRFSRRAVTSPRRALVVNAVHR